MKQLNEKIVHVNSTGELTERAIELINEMCDKAENRLKENIEKYPCSNCQGCGCSTCNGYGYIKQ